MDEIKKFDNEIWFGQFHYYIPHDENEIGSAQIVSGCSGLDEIYEGIGFVTVKEFFEAAKSLHNRLPKIRALMQTSGFANSSIEFVISELLETKAWLENKTKNQKL